MLSCGNKKSRINSLCEDVGKICIVSLLAYSAFVLISSACKKDKDGDYQDRLRKAYEGLSPEEY